MAKGDKSSNVGIGNNKFSKGQLKAINKLIGGGTKGAAGLANNFFGEGSLGRVASGFQVDPVTGKATDKREAENADVLEQYKKGLGGYTGAESQAMREAAARGLDSQYQTQVANLQKAAAKSGVRGGAAMANTQDLNQGRIAAQGNLETDLFVKNADEKQNRLNQYNQTLQGMRGDELQRQQFNLGQVGAEKSGQYGTFFGALGVGQSKKNQEQMNEFNKKLLELHAKQLSKPAAYGGSLPSPQTQQ